MKRIFFFSLCFNLTLIAHAQDFIPLWPVGKMPNSRHLKITDSIADEHIFRVAIPGLYAFFPGKLENKHAAIVICPGGAYERLAYVGSGLQLAKWFNTIGINAFVLNYRLPNSPDLIQRETGPMMDVQRAIRYVRSNAALWNIDPQKIGVMGTSSGGHLAASASLFNVDVSAIRDNFDTVSFKPDFTILISPVIDLSSSFAHKGSVKNLLGPLATTEIKHEYSLQFQVKPSAPPCFIVDAIDDKAVDPMNSLMLYQAMLQQHVAVTFHAFPHGAHAIALRNNPGSANLWTELCEEWLKEMGIITENREIIK